MLSDYLGYKISRINDGDTVFANRVGTLAMDFPSDNLINLVRATNIGV